MISRKKTLRLILIACTVAFLASCSRTFVPAGAVTAETSPFIAGLTDFSADYPDVDFSFVSVERHNESPEALDLVVWSGDYISYRWLGEEKLLNLQEIRPRLAAREQTHLFDHLRFPYNAQEYLLPFAGYAWGLIYRPEIVDAVVPGFSENPPTTFAELETVAVALESAGVTPFALGSQFGWPAAAWFSYFDIRLNGAEAHRRLIEGDRSYTDPTAVGALEQLRELAERGWFSEEAATMGWMDSVQEVLSGRAAFVLLGAYVFDRVPQSVELSMLRFPEIQLPAEAEGGGAVGELGQVLGLAVSASTGNPEGSAALAHAYTLAGAPGSTTLQDGYRTVAHRQDPEPPRAALSHAILADAELVLPSPERWVSPPFVQRGFRLFRSLVADPSAITAEEAARLMDLAGE